MKSAHRRRMAITPGTGAKADGFGMAIAGCGTPVSGIITDGNWQAAAPLRRLPIIGGQQNGTSLIPRLRAKPGLTRLRKKEG
jgi:hypothetical protein